MPAYRQETVQMQYSKSSFIRIYKPNKKEKTTILALFGNLVELSAVKGISTNDFLQCTVYNRLKRRNKNDFTLLFCSIFANC